MSHATRSAHRLSAAIIRTSLGLVLGVAAVALGQIPRPQDAPPPLPPERSKERFKLPPGFRIELVASEPLIREPSGVCWDERGQLFVCELHGYNLEGQYDIEELNKTGKLDRVVRRIQANDKARAAADAETYGTIKRLHDTDGDGRIDQAEVWADRLPPCHGICPARGGIIAVCQTQILFLADRDGDGRAEVREVLFEGFAKGPLERSINCPQWGPDNWIYVGRGVGGGLIRGPHLTKPVQLPATDFRIKPDGTELEPVVGGTHTMGFAFTESGDRFVISTRTPGIFVAPLSWGYLARNPDVPAPSLEESATGEQRVYPTSAPHPWRTRRAEDPGFSKYYRERYGIQESAPNGYFTSACSPLVYQDVALPGLRGQLLACEPAQNLVHRAVIRRDGSRLRLERAPGEEKSEFLASSDPWFHAIALAHAPDGSVFITDFYREIIEDYSAIPRYLQQEYGLINGKDHGRIWRLTHEQARAAPSANMSGLSTEQLAQEVGSPHFWRRETARRLLLERRARAAAPLLTRLLDAPEPATTLNALSTLDSLGVLQVANLKALLAHADAGVRRQASRLAERWLDDDAELLDRVLALAQDKEPLVRLQVALSLGESRAAGSVTTLVALARKHGDEPWLPAAILSAAADRGGSLLAGLLQSPADLGKGEVLLTPLCAAIAQRRQGADLSVALSDIARLENRRLQATCLGGLRSSFKNTTRVELTTSARQSLMKLAADTDEGVRTQAQSLVRVLAVEAPAERQARLERARREVADMKLDAGERLAAVAQLAAEDEPQIAPTLIAALGSSTPRVREAILEALFSRRERLAPLVDALERKALPLATLSAVQRAALLQTKDPELRRRATRLLEAAGRVKDDVFLPYVTALKDKRDAVRGAQVFKDRCASCHQAHGVGHAVGPDLSAEFQRAEETIVRDVLAPSDTITPGFLTYAVTTTTGQVYTGLLAFESPTSVTLRMAEGKEQVVLRKVLEELRALPVSLMPEDLAKTVAPRDLADLLSWLRRPPTALVLIDENRELIDALKEGDGTAEFIATDSFAGRLSLRVTPPQRHASRIKGWEFRIREHPGPGEYRFVRFAWKTTDAHGIMLELAADGHWPPAAKALRRYHAGKNTTGWQSLEVASTPPRAWTVVTRDLWRDFGDFTLTGLAPTTMGGTALFDRIELLQVTD